MVIMVNVGDEADLFKEHAYIDVREPIRTET